MLADGGVAIADLAMLRDQVGVFGPVASAPTAWQLLADPDERTLASLRSARAQAREVAWFQAAEQGEGIPEARAAGRMLTGLVLDLDATLVACHSEKQQAAPTYKGGFGFHPLLCFLANTGEALSGRLRPGNAGANTASDHIIVLGQALAADPRRPPSRHRHPHPHRQCRIRESLPRPRPRPAQTRNPHLLLGRIRHHRAGPMRCTGRARPPLASRPGPGRDTACRGRGRRADRHGQPGRLSGRHPHHRAPRTHPPRSPAVPVRSGRGPAASGVPDRHPVFRRRFRPVPGGPSPRACMRRGPHPVRQEHRLRPLPLTRLRRQCRLARTQPRGDRPARMGPRSAAGR